MKRYSVLRFAFARAVFLVNEIRRNLLRAIERMNSLFPGAFPGSEDTCDPAIVNALLSRHNYSAGFFAARPRADFARLLQFLDPGNSLSGRLRNYDNPLQPFAAVAATGSPPEGANTPIALLPRTSGYV